MTKVIQSQKEWKDFSTNGIVGIITTKFSENFLSKSYNVIPLSFENFREEVELNGIDTLFIDNDLYESDHSWYRKNRGHIINYFKNINKNICVIKNTSLDVSQIFKKAFVLEVNPNISEYKLSGSILEVPLLLDTNLYSPVDTNKSIDLTYYSLGKSNYTPNIKTLNLNFTPEIEVVSELKFTRKSLEKLVNHIKKSRVLYITHTELLDLVTLNYIEILALLNSTYVIFNHNFDITPQYGYHSKNFRSDSNKLTIALKNSIYTFKQVLGLQRKVLLNNTFLQIKDFEEFINTNKSWKEAPEISIITSTNRKDNLDFYFQQINNQKYVKLEINIVTHGFELNQMEKDYYYNLFEFPITFITVPSTESLGVCLNKAIEKSTLPVIAKIDDDDYYLEHYLIDQWLSLQYSSADIVGKSESYYYFEEEDLIVRRKIGEILKYGDFIMGATIMGNSDILKDFKFADLPKAVDTNFLKRVLERDKKIYIGHPFEMCVFRSSNDNGHTWKVNDLAMIKSGEIVGYGDPESYVRIK